MIPFILSEKQIHDLKNEFKFQYSRSSGPGGQKVNKTESRVELIWSVFQSQVFNDEQKSRIFKVLSNRINKEKNILFYSDRYRSRPQNQDHCERKFFAAIEKALSEQKQRKKTRPSRSSVHKRIDEKKQKGERKKARQKDWKSDY